LAYNYPEPRTFEGWNSDTSV